MVRSSALRSFWTALAVLALVAMPAVAQEQTGDVHGTVKDDKGEVLPGVTVTLKGATTAPQVQTSDEKGQFRFLQLYPGTYSLKAELEGFSAVEMTAVEVRLGGNTVLEVTMSSAVHEQITVTGEAPLLDERKTTQGANVAVSELNRVPTARDPWSLLSQAPGVQVDRINVGGNESGQQSNFIGLGSTARDNVFAVDGVVVTDMNSVGASATYFDFGAFEEVQFTTSGADVTVATSGVTVNQITKRGTNDWRANARYLDTDGQYQAKPSIVNGQGFNKIDSVKEQGVDVGGPLWKDHLWVWGSYGENDIRNLAPAADGAYQLDRTKLHDANFKLNFQLGPQDSGVVHYWNNDKLKFGRGAGPDHAPATTHDQTTPAKFYKLEDTYIPSANFVVTVLGSHNPGKFTLAPQGGLDPYAYIDANGVHQGTDYDFKQDAEINQYRADASYFFNTGQVSHELKFGAGYREQSNKSGTVWPHGIVVVDPAAEGIDDTTALAILPRNRNVAFKTQYNTAWVQDSLSLDRWTINAGLRYDGQKAKNQPSNSPENPFNQYALGPDGQPLLPAISFSGNDAGGFTWNTISPRLGVTYALGEQRKTLLRASYSRYAEQLGQDYAGRVNPLGYSYAYFYFQDVNHNDRLDPGELPTMSYAYVYNLNVANPASTVSANVNSHNLKPTLTDEITLGLDQGLSANTVLSALVVLRDIHDIPEDRLLVTDETGQTRATNRNDWVGTVITCPSADNPDCTLLPNGKGYSVTVYDLRDGLTPTGGTLRINGDRKQIYKGITLGLNRRLANRWTARGSFTWADWKWDIGSNFRQHADPTNLLIPTDGNDVYYEQSTGSGNKGNVFLGSRWSFNLYGMYQVAPERPWGFDIAASLSGREGYVSPPYLKVGGPSGSRLVQLAPIDEFRNPNVYTLDARIEKEFKVRDLGITVGLDGFNLLNKHYVLQRALRQDQANSNQVFETLSPRVVRWGVTLSWK